MDTHWTDKQSFTTAAFIRKCKIRSFSAADSAINKRKGKMKMKKLFIDSNYTGEM